MPKYSKKSLERLNTCHPDLREIFNRVIKIIDCSIIHGYRGEEEQNDAFFKGDSKLKFPLSTHNSNPSMGIDVAPYPIDWSNTNRFRYFAGIVIGVSETLLHNGLISHKVRWGGDWDMDHNMSDQSFNDLVHFELRKP